MCKYNMHLFYIWIIKSKGVYILTFSFSKTNLGNSKNKYRLLQKKSTIKWIMVQIATEKKENIHERKFCYRTKEIMSFYWIIIKTDY